MTTEADQLPRAATLFGAAEALREEIGAPVEPFERAGREDRMRAVRAGLGTSAFQKFWHDGRAMSLKGIIALGLEEATPQVPVGIQ